MNNDRKIFEEIQAFLSKPESDVAPRGLCVPVEESELHSLETDVIRQRLNEARASQHLLKQFSAEEIAHLQFVDEAVAVLNYRTLSEGVIPFPKKSAGKFAAGDAVSVEFYQGGSKKSRGTAKIDRVSDSYAWAKVDGETVQVLQSNGQEPVAPKADYFKFVKESVELDEAASVKLIDSDADLDQQIYSFNVDGKKVTFTYWDYDEEFLPDTHEITSQVKKQLGKLTSDQQNAVVKAVINDLKKSVKESVELDELSAKTLGSYVKKATVDVAQNSYNSGRKVHEPKEYHKSKQAAKSRIQGVMRAANKLSARNENAEPLDRKLWAELTEQARSEFEAYPSIASAGWIAREYSAQGGEWSNEESE